MEHTESCKKFKASYDANKAEYEAKWSHYCKTCGGWGYSSYNYDPSPHGVSLGSGTMTDTEVCSTCVEQGICPRCGELSLDEEGNKCLVCEWEYNVPGNEGLDPEPECDCYDRWMEEHEAEWEKDMEQMAQGVDWVEAILNEEPYKAQAEEEIRKIEAEHDKFHGRFS